MCITNDTKEAIFGITDTNLYVPVATLSTQDNAKRLEQLKSGFKRTINWNKRESKLSVQAPTPYLNFFISASFKEINGLFALSLENNEDTTVHVNLSLVEIKNYNVVTDGQNFFDQPVKNNLITYGNIRKILISQGDDYTTGCLLDDNYLDNYYKMMAIDLRKQQGLHTDPKAIQEINFKRNLNQGENINGNTVMFFIIEEPKETILNFLHGTVNVLWMYSTILFCFNIISIWNDSI